MKKKIIIKFLGLKFSRRDPIFQKLMGPRTPFWKCLAPTLCFMPKIVVYQTAPVWFVKNECFMAKINVYRSLLAGDRVIGWDIKMTSHPNSNASFINIWDCLIWRRSPNLTRSSKLAAAPNWKLMCLRLFGRTACTTNSISWQRNAVPNQIKCVRVNARADACTSLLPMHACFSSPPSWHCDIRTNTSVTDMFMAARCDQIYWLLRTCIDKRMDDWTNVFVLQLLSILKHGYATCK